MEFHKNKQITIIAKTESQVRQAGITLADTHFKILLNLDISVNILGKDELILSLNSPQKQKNTLRLKSF